MLQTEALNTTSSLQIDRIILFHINLMKVYLFFFLLFLLRELQARSKPTIDLSKNVIDSNRQWSRIKVGVTGGMGPYTYSYDQYPKGWRQVKDFLYAPKEVLEEKKKFPCKVRITDKNGESEQATIILEEKNQSLYADQDIYDYEQTFDISFYNTNGYYGKPELQKNILKTKHKSKRKSNKKRFIDIQQIQAIQKLSQISKRPGSGMSDFPQALELLFAQTRDRFQQQFDFSDSRNEMKVAKNKVRKNVIKDLLGHQYFQVDIHEPFEEEQSNLKKERMPDNFFDTDQLKNKIKASFSDYFQNLTKNTSSTTSTQIQQFQQSLSHHPKQYQTPQSTTLSHYNQQDQSVTVNSHQPIQSIDSIFLKLPSSQELDQIILGADGYAIIKTVQNVLQSNLTCEQKSAYLSDFLGRIESAIEMKSFALSQLQVIVQIAKQQIQRLDREIIKSTELKTKLEIDQLKGRLDELLIVLEGDYNEFNIIESQIQPLKGEIHGFQVDIETLRQNSKETRDKIQIQKLEITEIDSKIIGLERQLEDLKQRKKHKQHNIANLGISLARYQDKISQNYLQIKKLEKNIDQLQETSDTIKIKYTSLEIKVERLSNDIAEASRKQDMINERIEQLEERLRIQRKKLVTTEIRQINTMIEILQERIPSIEEQIDRFYYDCHNLSNVETRTQQSSLIYLVGKKDFTEYIRSSYGQAPALPTLTTQLEITPVNILSVQWQQKYGTPFSNSQIAQSSQFSFISDFNCLNPSTLTTNVGIIKKIYQRAMIIELENGSQVKLNLGTCTRLQSVSALPQIGQSIYFKGKSISNNQFNIYRGTCL